MCCNHVMTYLDLLAMGGDVTIGDEGGLEPFSSGADEAHLFLETETSNS